MYLPAPQNTSQKDLGLTVGFRNEHTTTHPTFVDLLAVRHDMSRG
jgi:hypothetical protein